MTMNTRFSMAVHIMTALAYLKQQISSELLAGSVNTNPVVVRRLLGLLNSAGLIKAERGIAGGFSLAHAPENISLLEIYRAVLDEQNLVGLHDNPKNKACAVSCKVRGALAVHLGKAQSAYEQELAKVKLTDIEKIM